MHTIILYVLVSCLIAWEIIGYFVDEKNYQVTLKLGNLINSNANKAISRDELERLYKFIQSQDELIALLWLKSFGEDEKKEERFGRGFLMESFGKNPNWYLNAMEYPNVFDTMCRYEDYPWGAHAEWLRR